MPVLDDVLRELADLERAGLLRRPHTIEGRRSPEVRIDGRPVVLFCSNDYLGLASDSRLEAALHRAIEEHGVGAGASRLISGTSPAHREAELRLAGLVSLPDALLFPSGYAANLGALSCLLGRDDVAFSDRLNHASLIDGLRLGRAATHIYDHLDADHLEDLLGVHRTSGRRAWIVSEAVFSMDGDLAPLARLAELCQKFDAGLFVDEAHALGVVGAGRGGSYEAGVRPDVLVGTLGKAAGLVGAFVAGTRELRLLLENRARSYVFSTAMPPAWAAILPEVADVIEGADEARARLRSHAERLRGALRDQGWTVPAGTTPIIPVVIGDTKRTMALSAKLLARGFFVSGIRPPTVPIGTSRLRVVPTAAHTAEQIEGLIAAFAELRAEWNRV